MVDRPLQPAACALDPECFGEQHVEQRRNHVRAQEHCAEAQQNCGRRAQGFVAVRPVRESRSRFGCACAKADAREMPARQWWQRYGQEAPELRVVATKALAQAASVTGCERTWSVAGFIHNESRYRLEADRAMDLTYCYQTLRLRENLQSVDRQEKRLSGRGSRPRTLRRRDLWRRGRRREALGLAIRIFRTKRTR